MRKKEEAIGWKIYLHFKCLLDGTEVKGKDHNRTVILIKDFDHFDRAF